MPCARQVIRRYGLQATETPTQKYEATPPGAVAVHDASQHWKKFGNTLGFIEDNPIPQLP
jgi:hypothetical protein